MDQIITRLLLDVARALAEAAEKARLRGLLGNEEQAEIDALLDEALAVAQRRHGQA